MFYLLIFVYLCKQNISFIYLFFHHVPLSLNPRNIFLSGDHLDQV